MKKAAEIIYASVLAMINVVAISFILSVPVYGYIDPSAVTYVVQAVAGVVIALGALVTVFRHKIFAFFKKGKKEDILPDLIGTPSALGTCDMLPV